MKEYFDYSLDEIKSLLAERKFSRALALFVELGNITATGHDSACFEARQQIGEIVEGQIKFLSKDAARGNIAQEKEAITALLSHLGINLPMLLSARNQKKISPRRKAP